MALDHRLSAHGQNVADAAACQRVATDLRTMLEAAPHDDPEVASLLADCAALDRVASWIGNRPVLQPRASTTKDGGS
jgi:hypothetical protein